MEGGEQNKSYSVVTSLQFPYLTRHLIHSSVSHFAGTMPANATVTYSGETYFDPPAARRHVTCIMRHTIIHSFAYFIHTSSVRTVVLQLKVASFFTLQNAP